MKKNILILTPGIVIIALITIYFKAVEEVISGPPLDTTINRRQFQDSRKVKHKLASELLSILVIRATPDGKENPSSPLTDNYVKAIPPSSYGRYHLATDIRDPAAYGGFGFSNNEAKDVALLSKGQGLYLLVQPNVLSKFAPTGMRLLLVNHTAHTTAFTAIDSAPNIVQEAQTSDGDWQEIEHHPEPICGNSFHRVFIRPYRYWEMHAFRYQGSMKTKIRFCLTLTDGQKIYSNEFDSSINPELFDINQEYDPLDIMDPYNE